MTPKTLWGVFCAGSFMAIGWMYLLDGLPVGLAFIATSVAILWRATG